MAESIPEGMPERVRINRKGARAYGSMYLEGREARVVFMGHNVTKVKVRRYKTFFARNQPLDRELIFANDEVEIVRPEGAIA